MAQKKLTDAEAATKYGTTDRGLTYPAVTNNNWGPDVIRSLFRLLEMTLDDLQAYQTDANADSVGVRAGRGVIDGTNCTYAGADEAVTSLANNDTTYVWATASSGAIAIASAIDGTGWPSVPHIKLAEVTMAAGVISALVDRRYGVALTRTSSIVPMATFGTWGIDVDGAETNGGGIVGGEVTLTQAAAAYCVVDDGGVQATFSLSGAESGYTANYQLFPDSRADNDAIYFGHSVGFCEMAIDMATAATYSGNAVTWEYYNGSAWSALTISRDSTDTTAQDGLRPFQQDGAVAFIPPTDWAATTVDGQSAYWVRARLSTAAATTNSPTSNSKNHETVAPTDGMAPRQAGTVTEIRLSDAAATLHTTADVKFILANFTTGLTTAALTFPQDKRTDKWTALTLGVNQGDTLGVLVTQEDGSAEPANVLLELTIAPA